MNYMTIKLEAALSLTTENTKYSFCNVKKNLR